MVCLGTKSTTDLQKSGHEFACLLTLLGYEAKFKEFMIKNIVTSCDIGFRIKVEELPFGFYEPEIFLALKYGTKPTFLIFHSGKIIATGSASKQEIDKKYADLYVMLEKFKK
jgi:transcription initiation factor TFIID TATA-box-binding protein